MSHQLCALSSPVVVCVRWPLFQLDLAIRLDRCVVACHCCHILPPAFMLLSWPQLHFSRHQNRQHPVESATLIEEFDKSVPIRREFFTPTSSTILREGGFTLMGRDNNMMMSRLMEYIMPGSRARNFDWPASSPRYDAIPPRAILRSDPVEDSGIQSSTPCLRVKVISRARESDAYWSRKRTNSLLCSLSKCL